MVKPIVKEALEKYGAPQNAFAARPHLSTVTPAAAGTMM